MRSRKPRVTSVALLYGLAIGCSDTLTSPTASAAKANMSSGTVSTTPASAAPPRTTMASPNFILEYSILAGPELAPGILHTDTRLKVDSKTRQATLISVRPGADAPEHPIGTFSHQLDPTELDALSAAARGINIPGAPTPWGAGPGTSDIRISYTSSDTTWAQQLNSRDLTSLGYFDAVVEPLNLLVGQLLAHPYRAIRLELRSGATPHNFIVRIHNVGQGPLAILDIGPLGCDDPNNWACVRIAEYPLEQPKMTAPPLQWTQIPLRPNAAPVAGQRAHSVVQAGAFVDWKTLPWSPTKPGTRHLAQAVVSDYQGPADVDGHPRVRGALFSDGLEFVP